MGRDLNVHARTRLFGPRSLAMRRAAQRPEPSRTAGMTAMPASPAPRKPLTNRGPMKRGKAA